MYNDKKQELPSLVLIFPGTNLHGFHGLRQIWYDFQAVLRISKRQI